MHKLSINVDIHEHRNTFQVNGEDQKELASSRENKTPPAGAPKAAATPAAAPPLTKSRFTLSLRNIFKDGNPRKLAYFGI